MTDTTLGNHRLGSAASADSSVLPAPTRSRQEAGEDRPAEANLPRLRLIARHALYEGVPVEVLAPLVEACEVRPLRVGEVLLTPGQTNTNLYLLLEGQLKVHIGRIDSQEGFEIRPGECTGEISVVDCRPVTAFVIADAPSQVLVLPETLLWERFLPIPAIAKNFMRLFANRLRARTEVMQRALEQQLRYEHLQKELAIAQDIQLGMVPRNLCFGPELDIVGEMTPAQQVGGDFYDAFPVSPDEYCIAIGDVSGKGVPAALFMVRTLTLLRTEVLRDQPINEALRRLNATLCEENATGMFATLIVGILNKHSGDFRYVNAGHDPVIFGAPGAAYRLLSPPRGILVGVDEDATYEVALLTLARGDVVLLYTDGVTEAMNPDGELFTVHRLMGALNAGPASGAAALADRINREVQGFAAGAPQSDDLTMVILQYWGP